MVLILKGPSTISLHFEKHKQASKIATFGRHTERVPGQKHSNAKIKDDRTKENIFLFTSEGNYHERIVKIMEKQYSSTKKIRKDAVLMLSATVQIGGYLAEAPESEQVAFLKKAFEQLKFDFGEYNIVSSVIHLDETTPHLHFDFVPIVDGKLSANQLIGSKDKLRNIQSNFLKDMKGRAPEVFLQRKSDQSLNGMEQKLFEKLTKENDDYACELERLSDILDERESSLEEKEMALSKERETFDKDKKQLSQEKRKLIEERNSVSEQKALNERNHQNNKEFLNQLMAREAEIERREVEVEQRLIEVEEKINLLRRFHLKIESAIKWAKSLLPKAEPIKELVEVAQSFERKKDAVIDDVNDVDYIVECFKELDEWNNNNWLAR